MNLPIAMNKTLSLRTYFHETEKKIEQKQLQSMMKSKLPRNIISKLEIKIIVIVIKLSKNKRMKMMNGLLRPLERDSKNI